MERACLKVLLQHGFQERLCKKVLNARLKTHLYLKCTESQGNVVSRQLHGTTQIWYPSDGSRRGFNSREVRMTFRRSGAMFVSFRSFYINVTVLQSREATQVIL